MSESNHFEKIESKASRLIAGKENKNLSNSSTLSIFYIYYVRFIVLIRFDA